MNNTHDHHNTTLSTFGIDGSVQDIRSVYDVSDVAAAVKRAKTLDLSVRPIGGGSNTILAGTKIDQFLLDVNIFGREICKENEEGVRIRIGAGETWDDIVQSAVKNSWAGITALSAIPGSVGAAPVQNIGAYGQVLADVLESVEVFDVHKETVRCFDAHECNFGYRTSRFKQNPGRFIVLSIEVWLEKCMPPVPEYGSVVDALQREEIDQPDHQQLHKVITDIRWSKLPRPEKTPNVGSFFTNPIVSVSNYEDIKSDHPDVPGFEQDNAVKIPAGWLIEAVGMKGEWCGSVGVSPKHALVLVSENKAKFSDLAELIGKIRHKVREGFGVELEREPRILF